MAEIIAFVLLAALILSWFAVDSSLNKALEGLSFE